MISRARQIASFLDLLKLGCEVLLIEIAKIPVFQLYKEALGSSFYLFPQVRTLLLLMKTVALVTTVYQVLLHRTPT